MTNDLTDILRGRTIDGTSNSGGEMVVSFRDGSKLTIETGETGSNSASSGGTVQAIRQTDDRLTLEFEDGGTMEIPLARGADSVSLTQDAG